MTTQIHQIYTASAKATSRRAKKAPAAAPSSDNGSTPSPPAKAKRDRQTTIHEKIKAAILTDDRFGMVARQACGRCTRMGLKCRIAQDPAWFDSHRCESCIKDKTKCCCSQQGLIGVNVTAEGLSTHPQTWQEVARDYRDDGRGGVVMDYETE